MSSLLEVLRSLLAFTILGSNIIPAFRFKPYNLLRLLVEPSFATIFQGVYFIFFFYILPLHVSAFLGHLQAEYILF
jgi:hypothetical protein